MNKAPLILGMLVLSPLGLAQTTEDIYPAPEVATSQVAAAIKEAARTHKRVILDFGGNWCGDCRALAKIFKATPNADLIKQGYILVEVNVGRFDKNKDIAAKYEVPLEKGVPALAVVDGDGKTVFSQKKGEFESMRSMDPASVTEFLKRWMPK